MRYVDDPVGIARIEAAGPKVARAVTTDVYIDMQRFTPVDTGALRESEFPEYLGSGGRVWVGTDHWIYPEYGTRYQHAQPYARPAIYRRRAIASVSI